MIYRITTRLAVMKALRDSEDLESKDGNTPPDAPRWSTLMCTLTYTPPATLDPPPRTATGCGFVTLAICVSLLEGSTRSILLSTTIM